MKYCNAAFNHKSMKIQNFAKTCPSKKKKINKQTNKQMTPVAHLVASQKMLEHVGHVKWNAVNAKLQAIARYMPCDRTSVSLMKKPQFKC